MWCSRAWRILNSSFVLTNRQHPGDKLLFYNGGPVMTEMGNKEETTCNAELFIGF